MYFPLIAQLEELVKSYYISLSYDANKAKRQLDEINRLRLVIALDAERRRIFYDQQNFDGNASGYREDTFFSRNDIKYCLKRGIAWLEDTVTVSLAKEGGDLRTITREPTRWQMLFSDIQQAVPLGQQTCFDFDQELRFEENESLSIGLENQTSSGAIFLHGCTLDENAEISEKDFANEIIDGNNITRYLPEFCLVPLIYKFTGVAGTYAVNSAGGDEILTIRNDRSVILTHISTTAIDSKITLLDEGRNQEICFEVEQRGIAADYTNRNASYYPLSYPHILRVGDRIKARVLNGSDISGNAQAVDVLNYTTFKGYYL